MSEGNSDRLGSHGDEGRFGWFAYAPEETFDVEEEDPVIRRVELRQHEHAGPFWDDEGHLSDDFDELHRWLGISRELFDEVMAWNDETAPLRSKPTEDWRREHFARQQQLLGRLGQEVHPGIEVDSPRTEPPNLVQLSRLNTDAASAHLVLWDEEAIETGKAKALPPTPDTLTRRALAWVADAWKYDEATPENNAAIFAWEDEGSAIARELQQVFGDDYRVVER